MSNPRLFDPERFERAARYYTSGRPTYPKLLARRVADLVGLADQNVLDLGSGPGFLAIDFTAFAHTVTAIDPSPEMLAAASNNAQRARVQIKLVHGSSYELGPHLGSFKLVTIGRAFHWMDRAATLATLDRLMPRGAAVALFGERYPDVPANAWYPEFHAILDRYRSGDPARELIRGAAGNEAVLLESPFQHLERIAVLEARRTSIERLVDRALSFAAVWQGLPGSREDDLAVEIRAAVSAHARPDGEIDEVLEGHALIARRAADVRAEID